MTAIAPDADACPYCGDAVLDGQVVIVTTCGRCGKRACHKACVRAHIKATCHRSAQVHTGYPCLTGRGASMARPTKAKPCPFRVSKSSEVVWRRRTDADADADTDTDTDASPPPSVCAVSPLVDPSAASDDDGGKRVDHRRVMAMSIDRMVALPPRTQSAAAPQSSKASSRQRQRQRRQHAAPQLASILFHAPPRTAPPPPHQAPVQVRVRVVHPTQPCPPPHVVMPVQVTALTHPDDRDDDDAQEVTWHDARAWHYLPSWFTLDREVF